MKQKSNLQLLWKLSNDFFSSFKGRVEKIYYLNRENFEIQNPIYNSILACTVFVRFDNKAIFGKGNCNFYNVYQRYRQMRRDWWNYLNSHNLPIFKNHSQIVPLFFPLLSYKAKSENIYSNQNEEAYGCTLISIDELIDKSEYYKNLKLKYALKYALKDKNNIIIGPDGGLLAALKATIGVKKSLRSFLDIGAGTGELSAYVLKRTNCCYIIANDYSPVLKKHLYSYVGRIARKQKAIFKLQVKNALNFQFPNLKKIDAISIGIFYGAQPSFILKYGSRLKKRLSSNGILFIQSCQLEGLFNLCLIHPCVPEASELKKWPWFKSRYNLSYWFGKNVKSIIMHEEIVTFASPSSTTIDSIIRIAKKNGARDFDLNCYELYKIK